MKIAILTPSGFTDYALLKSKCDQILINRLPQLNIITWGMNSKENLVRRYAHERNVSCKVVKSSYNQNMKRAAAKRLKAIMDWSDHFILFNDGTSPTINKLILEDMNQPTRVINLDSVPVANTNPKSMGNNQ
jgi:hypothetical protein